MVTGEHGPPVLWGGGGTTEGVEGRMHGDVPSGKGTLLTCGHVPAIGHGSAD